jgi:hypothetical protein
MGWRFATPSSFIADVGRIHQLPPIHHLASFQSLTKIDC